MLSDYGDHAEGVSEGDEFDIELGATSGDDDDDGDDESRNEQLILKTMATTASQWERLILQTRGRRPHSKRRYSMSLVPGAQGWIASLCC